MAERISSRVMVHLKNKRAPAGVPTPHTREGDRRANVAHTNFVDDEVQAVGRKSRRRCPAGTNRLYIANKKRIVKNKSRQETRPGPSQNLACDGSLTYWGMLPLFGTLGTLAVTGGTGSGLIFTVARILSSLSNISKWSTALVFSGESATARTNS